MYIIIYVKIVGTKSDYPLYGDFRKIILRKFSFIVFYTDKKYN